MTSRKTRSIKTHQQTSPEYGIHSRRLIRVSKKNLERLSTLRFHCNFCKRWLPALAFYTQVAHAESEAANDAIHLERYEVKAEGFKGRETVVVCEECAVNLGQG
jgi:hypothetical protein